MRRTLTLIFSILAGMWIGWAMFFGAAGSYFTHNPEALIDEKALHAKLESSEYGAVARERREEVARIHAASDRKRCEAARTRFRIAWDKAVESNTTEQRAEALERLESHIEEDCQN